VIVSTLLQLHTVLLAQYYANEMLKLLVLKLLHYTNNVSITNNTGDNQAPENNSPAGSPP